MEEITQSLEKVEINDDDVKEIDVEEVEFDKDQDIEEEVWTWLDFMGFSKYAVSSHGRVLHVEKMNIMNPKIGKNGYKDVHIRDDEGKDKHKRVHILVARAYCGAKKGDNDTVDHIYGDKSNNRASDLRWASPSMQAFNRKKRNMQGRLVAQFDSQGKFMKIWNKMEDAAKAFGTDTSNISLGCKKGYRIENHYWRYYDGDVKDEVWKPIIDDKIKEGYQVSSHGRIKKLKGAVTYGTITPCGYFYITFKPKEGTKRVGRYIQRVVAAMFHGPDESKYVNHKDGNKTNNHYLNLEYVTKAENSKHALDMGLMKPGKGRAKNPNERILKIDAITKQVVGIYNTTKEAGDSVGSAHTVIATRITKGTTLKGFLWEKTYIETIDVSKIRRITTSKQ
jgi:hypothetical protein